MEGSSATRQVSTAREAASHELGRSPVLGADIRVMRQEVMRSACRARHPTHLRSDHEVQNGAPEPRPTEAAGHLPAGEGEEEDRGEHAEADWVDRFHI